MDCEHLFKTDPQLLKRERTQAATVDIINYEEQSLYSTKVHHQHGTFSDHPFWRKLTGFHAHSFASVKLPTLRQVRETVKKLIAGKLIVTVGGDKDFESLGLSSYDFETFDLQDHFFVSKENANGVKVREPHSLRSLSSFFLKYNPQQGRHESEADALSTMRLFKIYCMLKIKDDPLNLGSKYNIEVNYNHIPVVKDKLYKK
jgi:hypothetical protein